MGLRAYIAKCDKSIVYSGSLLLGSFVEDRDTFEESSLSLTSFLLI